MSFGFKASIRTGAIPVRAGVGTLGIGATASVHRGGSLEVEGRSDLPCPLQRRNLQLAENAVGDAENALLLCRFWAETSGGDCSDQEAALRDAQDTRDAALFEAVRCMSQYV